MACLRRASSAAKYPVGVNSVFCSRRVSSTADKTTAVYRFFYQPKVLKKTKKALLQTQECPYLLLTLQLWRSDLVELLFQRHLERLYWALTPCSYLSSPQEFLLDYYR
jgi:hypothetical protein